MVTDWYTKMVLTVIAIALSLIALNPWVAPLPASAQLSASDLSSIEGDVSSIKSHLGSIYRGICLNNKIC